MTPKKINIPFAPKKKSPGYETQASFFVTVQSFEKS
jgi:hypothetical protein